MRILVTASRTWADPAPIHRELDALLTQHPDMHLIVGDADGGDQIAITWAQERDVPHEIYRALWRAYGKKAGMVRNAEMVNSDIDECLAFIRDSSRGASGCARLAEQAGIPVKRIQWEGAVAAPAGDA